MNINALELPDEIADWPVWLERQLVGVQLRELVQQLELIANSRPSKRLSLNDAIGDKLPLVLEKGLNELDGAQLKLLVENPRLLISLQELVFTRGGNYWIAVQRGEKHIALIDKQWLQLQQAIQREDSQYRSTGSEALAEVASPKETAATELRSSQTLRWVIGALAVAATVVLAWLPWANTSSGETFFARRDVLSSPLKDAAYLRNMANAVTAEWQPDLESVAYQKQMDDFLKSCDRLLAAELEQLQPAARVELKTLCQRWRDKVQSQLDELQGGKQFATVQSEVNAIIARIQPALSGINANA